MRSDLQIKINNAEDLLKESENIQPSEYESYLKQLGIHEHLLNFCISGRGALKLKSFEAMEIRKILQQIDQVRKVVSDLQNEEFRKELRAMNENEK